MTLARGQHTEMGRRRATATVIPQKSHFRRCRQQLDGRPRSQCCAFFDADLRRVVEPGQFRVLVGSSPEDIRVRGEFVVR